MACRNVKISAHIDEYLEYAKKTENVAGDIGKS
jgi:hypothetical protein